MHGGLVGLLVWEGPVTPGQMLLSCVRKQTSEQRAEFLHGLCTISCLQIPAPSFLKKGL